LSSVVAAPVAASPSRRGSKSRRRTSESEDSRSSPDSPRSADNAPASASPGPVPLSPTAHRPAAFRNSGGVVLPSPSVAIAIPTNGSAGGVITPPLASPSAHSPLLSPSSSAAASAEAVSWDQLQRKNAALSTIKAAMYSNAAPSGAAGGAAGKSRITSMQFSRTQPLPDVQPLMGNMAQSDLSHVGAASRFNDADRSSAASSPASHESTPIAATPYRGPPLQLSDSVIVVPSPSEARPETSFPTMPTPQRAGDDDASSPVAPLPLSASTPNSSGGGGVIASILSPRSRRKQLAQTMAPGSLAPLNVSAPASAAAASSSDEIKRADPQDAFEAKRAANRSAYTRSIVKPANTVDKSPAQEHYYRQMLLGELLDTELEYTTHMRFVVDKFLQPARASGMLSEKELASMFGDVEQVRDASATLVGALQARLSPATAGDEYECIGDAFAAVHGRLAASLTPYCVGHEPARLFTEALLAERPALADYFETLRRQSDAEFNSLEAYLIKPVQRVMKYPLLLAELLRYTPAEHRDRIALDAAHDRAKGLAHEINAIKRDYEGRRRWAEIAPTIETAGDFDMAGSDRMLLFEADLACGALAAGGDSVTYVGTRRFWLCDDVVLCGKARTGGKQKYKMTALFRLAPDASAVATHGAVNEKDLAHCFQIVSFARDAESLVLGFESERSRDEWFSTLQSLLRQAFERQRQRTAASQAGGDAKLLLAASGGGVASGDGAGAAAPSAIEAMDDAQRAALSDAEVRDHLTAAFCEFVTSETSYVEQLSMCVRRYLRPLRSLHMQPSELTHLFEAIERVVPVHANAMLPCVASINPNADADVGASEARLQAALAKAVDELASNFDAHAQHAQMLDAALVLYERLNSPGSPFNSFVNEASQTGSVDDPDLLTLMPLPLKRVGEYAALMRRVALSTRSAPARALVERAEGTAARLAASLQAAFNLARLQALARRITGVPDSSPIVAVGRRAIAESPLKIGGKPHHAWLFSDRVVYGKPAQKGTFKYKGEFDLRDQTLIRNFIDTKSVSNAFELVRVADRTTVVCAMPDSTTKQTWMVAISNAIREHMRAAATRLRTLSTVDCEASQAAAATALAAVAGGGASNASSLATSPVPLAAPVAMMPNSPPLSPMSSPRSSPLPGARMPRATRVCEFCHAVPPVAKVVFTDGRPPLRTCESCTALLNANPNAKPPAAPVSISRSASATVQRAAFAMSPPPQLSASSAVNPKAGPRRSQSVFQVAAQPATGSGRGLLPVRPARTALRTASPDTTGPSSPFLMRARADGVPQGSLTPTPGGTQPPVVPPRRTRAASAISGQTDPSADRAPLSRDDSALPTQQQQQAADKPPPLPPQWTRSLSDVTSDDSTDPPLPETRDHDNSGEDSDDIAPPPPPAHVD
jgi:hypothetical protein